MLHREGQESTAGWKEVSGLVKGCPEKRAEGEFAVNVWEIEQLLKSLLRGTVGCYVLEG